MIDLIGSLRVFVLVTVGIFGMGAMATGNSVAAAWKPVWHLVFYCFLIALANRFIIYALFGGELLAPSPFLFAFAIYWAWRLPPTAFAGPGCFGSNMPGSTRKQIGTVYDKPIPVLCDREVCGCITKARILGVGVEHIEIAESAPWSGLLARPKYRQWSLCIV